MLLIFLSQVNIYLYICTKVFWVCMIEILYFQVTFSLENVNSGLFRVFVKNLNKVLKFVTYSLCWLSSNRRVAIEYQFYMPQNRHFHERKQISSIVSMLTRLVYFTQKETIKSNSNQIESARILCSRSPSFKSIFRHGNIGISHFKNFLLKYFCKKRKNNTYMYHLKNKNFSF